MPAPVDPPNVWVAGNRWTDIPVPELGEWEPSLTVSVVLPFYERSRELNLTLAGLSEQTYPHHLMQVIVADDGSRNDPPRPPADLPFDLEVVRQEDLGYGLARARNLGAKAAEGEVVVFLDCDMIPERRHIEAHARWHHAARRLVTIGFRFHASFDDVSPNEVAEAVRSGRMRDIAGGEIERPEWIESHLRRMAELTGSDDDVFLIMSGGNLGIDRDLYWEAGGNDETFTRWGGEDNEFGYRVMQLGAVIVPERAAVAWHQGEGHVASAEELESIRLQRPRLRNQIAEPRFRRPSPGRAYSVPRVVVSVLPHEHDAEIVSVTVDSLLASSFTDLVVGIAPLGRESEQAWIEDEYENDSRVVVRQDPTQMAKRFPFSPIRMTMPAGHAVDSETLRDLAQGLGADGVGAIYLTLPGRPARDGAKCVLTRAYNRARQICEETDLDGTIGRLFGEKWVSGASIGIWQIEDAEASRLKITESAVVSPEEDLRHQIELRDAELAAFKARRSVAIADAVGLVVRARTWGQLGPALREIRRLLARRG